MTCSRSPCPFSSRVIGRSSQSGPLQGVVTLGTIGQMALPLSGHKCQHYSDSVQPRGLASRMAMSRRAPYGIGTRPRKSAIGYTGRSRSVEGGLGWLPEELIRAYFGAMRAAEVTAAIIDRYIAARVAAKKSNATVNRETAILATAFKFALRRGKLTTAPLIRKLPETTVRRVFYEKIEFEGVVSAAPEYLRDALKFFYATGWRKQEVVGLQWNMANLAAGSITLPTSKNTRGRTLAISGDLVEMMKRREQARLVEGPDGGVKVAEHVFHRQGQPLGDFKRTWATARVTAGLAHLVKDASGKVVTKKNGTPRYVFEKTIHDFRRTA